MPQRLRLIIPTLFQINLIEKNHSSYYRYVYCMYIIYFPQKNWAKFKLVFIPLTGNSFIKSYKCKTGPASKFLINGRSKSCTCFEQCLSWAACHMTLICSLVIFPSTAKKLRSTWHCFMTSTCKFGPKINSTIFWVKIQPKSWKNPFKILQITVIFGFGC